MKTIFLTSSTGVEGKNYEHIMRVIFLSRFTDLTLLISKRADFQRYITTSTKTWRCPWGGGKVGLILYSFIKLFGERKRLDNVILFTEPSVLGIAGGLAKLLSGIKWVVDVWDIPIRYTGNNKLTRWRIGLTRRLMKVAYRLADLFIVGIRTDLEFNYYNIPDSKILAWPTTIWIPKGKKEAEAQRDEDHFNLICMKSLHNHACGLDVLLQAFPKVKQQIPQARLWIVGRLDKDVAKAIEQLRHQEGVEICGFVEHTKLLEMIRQADLAVIPWRNEVDLAQLYPTKVMEYMTEGKVVVASRLAGIADMITDGHDGILVRPGDPEDLANNIIELYHDEERRQQLASNAQKYHRKFDTICKHEEIFRNLKRLINDTSDITPFNIKAIENFF